MSAAVFAVLVGMLEVAAVVIGLGGVALVANRLPTVTETMTVLVVVSAAVVVSVVWLLMPPSAVPRFVEAPAAAVPTTYGPPPTRAVVP